MNTEAELNWPDRQIHTLDLHKDCRERIAKLTAEVERLEEEHRSDAIRVNRIAGTYRAECESLRAECHRLRGEVERLTGCLKKVNAQAEEFERKWYLATDENTRLKALIEPRKQECTCGPNQEHNCLIHGIS